MLKTIFNDIQRLLNKSLTDNEYLELTRIKILLSKYLKTHKRKLAKKVCTDCILIKKLEEFCIDNYRKDKICTYCKACKKPKNKKTNKTYYERTKRKNALQK